MAFCDRVLAVDRRIGFVMVVDANGEILESKLRGRRLMSDETIAAYTGMWTVLIRGIARQMERFLGSNEYYSLGYEKLTVFGLTIREKTIVITARRDLPLEKVLGLKEIQET